MIKEFLNKLADPIISFPLVTILFVLMYKYYRFVGTKKFLVWFSVISLAIFGWACTDPNFLAIILWRDNIPISILVVMLVYFSGFHCIRLLLTTKELKQGMYPYRSNPEERERRYGAGTTWFTLSYLLLSAVLCFLLSEPLCSKRPLKSQLTRLGHLTQLKLLGTF